MNNIKSQFSIKDLENLSGIKAHTIRIWEKRYNLFEPKRTETNIRYYSLESLQKLLNVTFLYNNGYKISKISDFGNLEIASLVKELSEYESSEEQALNAFKLAMINFDKVLFLNTYDALTKHKTFRNIFYDVFIPLMNEIGLLWQTNTITPAQEHFISELIIQKILINTEKLESIQPLHNSKTFVLYLPDNEIHELGLRFLNFEILQAGYQTIYLGPSVPISSLTDVLKHYKNIIFVSYFTIEPLQERINDYLKEIHTHVLKNKNNELWALGRMTQYIELKNIPEKIRSFSKISELVEKI